MTDQQVMKCPGCQQIIEVAKYGDHMLASTQQAHSSVGVVPAPAIAPISAPAPAMMYPVVGAQPPAGKVKQKHFLKLWLELWEKSAWGMVTFGFFMFSLGLIVEWYYFVR